MKSLLSSCFSKINVLTGLCIFGVSMFSIPVAASPQEVCVRTSDGNVVCGTPVKKPRTRSHQSNSNNSALTVINRSVVWELKSCVRHDSNVICTFLVRPLTDIGRTDIGKAKIVDNAGNEYVANGVQFGNRQGGGGITVNMVKGAQYETAMNFPDVPTSVSRIILLEINVDGGVKFRNVSIY